MLVRRSPTPFPNTYQPYCPLRRECQVCLPSLEFYSMYERPRMVARSSVARCLPSCSPALGLAAFAKPIHRLLGLYRNRNGGCCSMLVQCDGRGQPPRPSRLFRNGHRELSHWEYRCLALDNLTQPWFKPLNVGPLGLLPMLLRGSTSPNIFLNNETNGFLSPAHVIRRAAAGWIPSRSALSLIPSGRVLR